jgi:hypothetical protein
LDQIRRREFPPRELIPHVDLLLVNADGRQPFDKLRIGHTSPLKLSLQEVRGKRPVRVLRPLLHHHPPQVEVPRLRQAVLPHQRDDLRQPQDGAGRYPRAICIFVNAAKGISALQLSRDLGCQYKTAFVLAHKLREAMAKGNNDVTLFGTVEIDGGYFGGHVRPENRKEDRKDRRLAQNQNPNRRVVVVMRERNGRTLPFVVKAESEGAAIVRDRVASCAILHADEGAHWDPLELIYAANRITHSEGYSIDGACTNHAPTPPCRSARSGHERTAGRW